MKLQLLEMLASKKCIDLFNQKRDKSNLLMVSHNLNSLADYCDHAILFDKQQNVHLFSEIEEAIYQYKIINSI